MANPSPADPFLEVAQDVESTLTSTRHLFSSYLRIRATAHPLLPELASSRSDLHSNLTTLSTDLADLLESIAAVESDPYRFGIDDVEVGRRRSFVRDVGGEVEGMRRELEIITDTATHVADGDEDGEGNMNTNGEGDAYGEIEAQQQQQMMHEQDEQLDGVFRTVGVLRNQAEDMGRELEEQGAMLEEVDTLADRVGGKLNVGVKRVGDVIRRNEDGVSSCCIGVLGVVLVMLLIMVIVL